MIHAIQSSPFIQAIGWTLLHSLWQITIVGIVLWILLNFISKKSAPISYGLSVSALFVICIWTGLTFNSYVEISFSQNEISTTSDVSTNIMKEQTPTISNNPIPSNEISNISTIAEQPFTWKSLIPFFALLWMLGVLIFGIRFTKSWWHIYFLKKTRLPLPDPFWQIRTDYFSQKIGIQKQVRLFLSENITSPITFGHFKPILLFPTSMLTGLTNDQVEMLLLHELAHIRRSDFLINLIQSLLEVVLFYHPIIWWISKQIRISREHCCDDMAVAICNDHLLYAQTLTQLQATIFSHQKSLAMSANGTQGTFTYRIQRLFQQRDYKPSYLKSVFSFGLVALCLMMLAFQQPFLDEEKNEAFPNEGMLYVVTTDRPQLELREIQQKLTEQNVKLEISTGYKINSFEVESIYGKIIMPDKSYLTFYVEEFQYVILSLDWSKEKPLSLLLKGAESGVQTYPEGNGLSAMSAIPQTSPGPPNYPCYLDQLGVGNINHRKPAKLFTHNSNNGNPIFFLDGKKITATEIRRMEIQAIDIFSIIKISPQAATNKYNISNESNVYEITTRLNDRQPIKIENEKDECKRKILWGDRIFTDSNIELSVEEFLRLKDYTIKFDHCGTIHEMIHFSLSSQNNTDKHYIFMKEKYNEGWSDEVSNKLSSSTYDQFLMIDGIRSTQGVEKPFSITVGDHDAISYFLKDGEWVRGKEDIGNVGIMYNISPAYFQDWDELYYNQTFLLNEKKLNSTNGFLPSELLNINKIDSIIALTGEYARNAFPELKSDTIWSVYSNFKKLKSSHDTKVIFSDGISIIPTNDKSKGYKTILPGGPIKITNNYLPDEDFKLPLYFLNGTKLPIPKGKRIPIDVKKLEVIDSLIVLTGKYSTDIYGEEGKHGVWLIYATAEPLDNEIVHHKFSLDEKALFEKSIQVHPNPIIDKAFISFEAMLNQHNRVQIFDQQGRIVTTIFDGLNPTKMKSDRTGVIGYFWETKNIPAGIYFARIEIGGEVFTRKIVKVDRL